MRNVILIPWRSRDERSDRSLAYLLEWYAPLGLETFTADSGHDPFNRSASRNLAAEQAGDWDAAMLSDGDTLAEPRSVALGFEMAHSTGKLVLPHDDYWAISEEATERLYARQITPIDVSRRRAVLSARHYHQSGAVIVTRAAWDRIGGYDPGFLGWGCEDDAFILDAKATVGVKRMPGMCWHLWHPRNRAQELAERDASLPLLAQHGVQSQT